MQQCSHTRVSCPPSSAPPDVLPTHPIPGLKLGHSGLARCSAAVAKWKKEADTSKRIRYVKPLAPSQPVPHAGVVFLERLQSSLLIGKDTIAFPAWSPGAVLADEDPLLRHRQSCRPQIIDGGQGEVLPSKNLIISAGPASKGSPLILTIASDSGSYFWNCEVQRQKRQLTNSSYSAVSLGSLSTFFVSIHDISLYRASKTSRYRLPMWALWNLCANF